MENKITPKKYYSLEEARIKSKYASSQPTGDFNGWWRVMGGNASIYFLQ